MNNSKKETAVLMAAGIGSRMRPLTDITPKPLIKVNGKPMIETMIESLKMRGVEEIIVVTGYLSEQFEYLKEKYSGVKLIYNKDYLTKNNISSVYAAADFIEKSNCFICESDIYISDESILCAELPMSCYYGKFRKGFSDDWLFDLDTEGYISGIHKCGTDKYNMTGICYFTRSDAKILSDAIRQEYAVSDGNLYWDEVVDKILGKINMTVHPVDENQITEIDTVEELKLIDPSYN